MKVWKKTVALLSLLALQGIVLPEAALPEADPAPAAVLQPPAPNDGGGGESMAVEQTLRKALEKSEAERADLDRRYREAVGRETEARQDATRLAAEKEALEKLCVKTADQEAKPKPAVKARKKSSSRKWWISGKETRKGPSAGAKSRKKVVKTAGKKVKSADKGAGRRKKACNGPVVSMAEVKRAMAGTKNLAGKNLSGMNLTGMSLVGANLKGACLARTNLERADLGDADLERAELSGANLRSASLRLANVNAAILEGATLDNAVWPDSRICLPGSVGSCRDIIH